jgi:hypothetical protein
MVHSVAQKLQEGRAIKLVNKNFSFMDPELSLSCSYTSASGPYSVPVQCNISISVFRIFSILYFHVRLRPLIDFFPPVYQKYTRTSHFAPPLRKVSCHAHFIFSILVILILSYLVKRKHYKTTLDTIFSILLPVPPSYFKYFFQRLTSSPCAVIIPLLSILLSNTFK